MGPSEVECAAVVRAGGGADAECKVLLDCHAAIAHATEYASMLEQSKLQPPPLT